MRKIQVPARCPECGAATCVEYAGHSPVRPFGLPKERVVAVHCGDEHDGGQSCDWRMPIVTALGEEITLVPAETP